MHSGWYDRTRRRARDLSCGPYRIYLEFEVRRASAGEGDGGTHRRSVGCAGHGRDEKPYAVTVNDADLTERMLPTLKRVAGEDYVKLRSKTTGAEDFSFFAQKAPGLFIFLGGSPKGTAA
jgi:metal-dependent amidase/aminoacylase/carboxypeptidase family protein